MLTRKIQIKAALDTEVTLDDVQHDEMCKIIKEMERDNSGKLMKFSTRHHHCCREM